jgi:hypothetical protein
MRHLLTAALILGLATSSAYAAQCRDSAGKFMKCPPPMSKVVHCRDHSGKFVKCSMPGAKPA